MRIFPIVFTLLCGAGQLCAQLEPDGANDANYLALGSQYTGRTVWVGALNLSGQNVVASGILLDPYDVVAAAHFAANATVFEVGNGSNTLTSPGNTVGVSSVLIYPGFPNDGNFNTPDLAIIHLASPLGNGLQAFAGASSGELVIMTGFGLHGTPSGGTSYDGALRGWNGYINNTLLPGNVSPAYYDNVFFPSAGASLPGNTLSRSSGGAVYDSLGEVVGMLEAQTGGNSADGGQQFLDFAKSGVESWIATNLTPYLVFNTAGTNLVLQWNGSFILQSSTNLTAGFADITNAASPYTNAMTAPQIFFRLRSTP